MRSYTTLWCIIMAALWNRAGHHIFVLWFLLHGHPAQQMRRLYFHPVVSSIFLLPFFPRLFSAIADCIYHTSTHGVAFSANLRWRSEMCCTWLAENTGCKKSPKNSLSAHNRTTLSGNIFANEACIINQKKPVKQQYLLHMSLQCRELWPTNGWDRFESLGHPSKFQQVSRLGVITALTSLIRGQPNFARCLVVSRAGTLYTHFQGLLPPKGILQAAKFTLCLSLALSYIGSVTAQHSSSGRQPNFAAWYKEWS